MAKIEDPKQTDKLSRVEHIKRQSRLEHIERHKELHQKLDELVADFIDHNNGYGTLSKLPSNTKLSELMEWSYKQTIDPSEKRMKVKCNRCEKEYEEENFSVVNETFTFNMCKDCEKELEDDEDNYCCEECDPRCHEDYEGE